MTSLLLVATLLASAPSTLPPRPSGPLIAAAPDDLPERVALRAIAHASAGDPEVAAVQAAAAREADRLGPDPARHAARLRLAALLPHLTAELRHEEQANRTVGLQGSGEVDYLRISPGNVALVRATWHLPDVVAGRGELAAIAASADRARRRAERVERATALHFERRQRRVALLLDPPADPLARAEAELEIARLGAELDALTGGLYSGAAR